MRNTIRLLVLLSGAFASVPALAQITIKDPWVRATVPQQSATGAFMELVAQTGSRLIEARSPVANIVEIHEMAMDGNVMRMRAVNAVELPPGRTVALKPGGYHVMLMDLKGQIKAGDQVPLTLVFEKDGKREQVEVRATARPLNAGAAKGG